jgi:hypothetical protein
VSNRRPICVVDGVEVFVTDRRRYGDTTFTWLHAIVDGEPTNLADPWPCVHPPRAQVEMCVRDALARCVA